MGCSPASARALALLMAFASSAVVSAQDDAAPAPRPRVLLIGDQGLSSHLDKVGVQLKDEAEVVRSPLGHLATGAALERIDELLGDSSKGPAFDVVCFNFGLSDLMCRDPRTKEVRAMSPAAGGVPVTPLARYRENLKELVAGFRAAGVEPLWISTPPLHPRSRNSALDPAAIPAYNAAAAAIMAEHDVRVFDAHAQVEELLEPAKDARARDRLHNDVRRKDLSEPLVEQLRTRLGN